MSEGTAEIVWSKSLPSSSASSNESSSPRNWISNYFPSKRRAPIFDVFPDLNPGKDRRGKSADMDESESEEEVELVPTKTIPKVVAPDDSTPYDKAWQEAYILACALNPQSSKVSATKRYNNLIKQQRLKKQKLDAQAQGEVQFIANPIAMAKTEDKPDAPENMKSEFKTPNAHPEVRKPSAFSVEQQGELKINGSSVDASIAKAKTEGEDSPKPSSSTASPIDLTSREWEEATPKFKCARVQYYVHKILAQQMPGKWNPLLQKSIAAHVGAKQVKKFEFFEHLTCQHLANLLANSTFQALLDKCRTAADAKNRDDFDNCKYRLLQYTRNRCINTNTCKKVRRGRSDRDKLKIARAVIPHLPKEKQEEFAKLNNISAEELKAIKTGDVEAKGVKRRKRRLPFRDIFCANCDEENECDAADN